MFSSMFFGLPIGLFSMGDSGLGCHVTDKIIGCWQVKCSDHKYHLKLLLCVIDAHTTQTSQPYVL